MSSTIDELLDAYARMTQRAAQWRQTFVTHTPWARANFTEEKLWMACYCGWNANRDAEGSWNDHFLESLGGTTAGNSESNEAR